MEPEGKYIPHNQVVIDGLVDIKDLHPEIAVNKINNRFSNLRKKMNKSQSDYRDILPYV